MFLKHEKKSFNMGTRLLQQCLEFDAFGKSIEKIKLPDLCENADELRICTSVSFPALNGHYHILNSGAKQIISISFTSATFRSIIIPLQIERGGRAYVIHVWGGVFPPIIKVCNCVFHHKEKQIILATLVRPF